MNSQGSSLYTDSENDEEIRNLSISCISYELDLSRDSLEYADLQQEQHDFPNISISISSNHDNAENLNILQELNNEIKQAIILNCTKFKLATQQLSDDVNTDFLQAPQELNKKKSPRYSIEINDKFMTLETEENADILQEIASNLKSLNESLQLAKMNLVNDKNDLQMLHNEQEELKKQFENVASKLYASISMESSERISDITCRCSVC